MLIKPLEIIRIALLEDSAFYNTILSRRIENFTSELGLFIGCNFKIETYLHADDFILNLDPDTDIIVIDYFLDNNKTGEEVLRDIRKKCQKSEIILISQSQEMLDKTSDKLSSKVAKYLVKDKYAIPTTCFFIEDYATRKIKQVN